MIHQPRPWLVDRIRRTLGAGHPMLLDGSRHFHKRDNVIAACQLSDAQDGVWCRASVALPELEETVSNPIQLEQDMALSIVRSAAVYLPVNLGSRVPNFGDLIAWVAPRLRRTTVVMVTGAETIFAPGKRRVPSATMAFLLALRQWMRRGANGEQGWNYLRFVFLCNAPLWTQPDSRLDPHNKAGVPVFDNLDVQHVNAYSPEEVCGVLTGCHPDVSAEHMQFLVEHLGCHPWFYECAMHLWPLGNPQWATLERLYSVRGPTGYLMGKMWPEIKETSEVPDALRLFSRSGMGAVDQLAPSTLRLLAYFGLVREDGKTATSPALMQVLYSML